MLRASALQAALIKTGPDRFGLEIPKYLKLKGHAKAYSGNYLDNNRQ